MAWLEEPQTWNAHNAPFSFTTITAAVLLFELITNPRNFMVGKPSLARRATDGSRSSTEATRVWRTCHDQELQSSTTGRGNSKPSKQIPKVVCGRGRQAMVFQRKSFVVSLTRTARVLEGREWPHSVTAREAHWHLHLVAWSRRQHSTDSLHHRPRWKVDLVQKSRPLPRMVWRRSRSWACCEAANSCQERDAVFFLLLRTTSVLGDPWRK